MRGVTDFRIQQKKPREAAETGAAEPTRRRSLRAQAASPHGWQALAIGQAHGDKALRMTRGFSTLKSVSAQLYLYPAVDRPPDRARPVRVCSPAASTQQRSVADTPGLV